VGIGHLHPDRFRATTPPGEIKMTNVIAKNPGAEPDAVILGMHCDTKRMKWRLVGTNDGTSSAAFLLEMARVLAHRGNCFTYWI